MCWNQPARVDYLRKKWRAAQKKIQKKGQADPGPMTKDRRPPVTRLSATSGRGRVVAGRLDPNHWSPAARRPRVADPRSLAKGRPVVARRPRVDTWTGSAWSFFLNFFIFLMLPPTLWSIFY
jgi:hypothetical protein